MVPSFAYFPSVLVPPTKDTWRDTKIHRSRWIWKQIKSEPIKNWFCFTLISLFQYKTALVLWCGFRSVWSAAETIHQQVTNKGMCRSSNKQLRELGSTTMTSHLDILPLALHSGTELDVTQATEEWAVRRDEEAILSAWKYGLFHLT